MSEILQKFEHGEIQAGYRQLIEDWPVYIELSRDMAHNHAESYREFDVGNVGIGIKPGQSELITFSGANFKIKHLDELNSGAGMDDTETENFHDDPEAEIEHLHSTFNIPREAPAFCAEMATIAQAENDELFFIAHVTTASSNENEIKEITGVSTRTLPPCEPCVAVLDRSSHTGKATLYASASLDEDIFQLRNMRLLKQLYRRGSEKLPVARLSVQNTKRALELFDSRMGAHDFSKSSPSYAVSSFARTALVQAAVSRK